MTSPSKLTCAIAALSALWVLPCATSPALAQGSDATGTQDLSEVVITGTRIVTPNLTSTSPVQVVTAKDIALSGHADVTDLINMLPQNFINSAVDFGNTSNSLSTPGGIATVDLRGLGPQRTLVLVDGKRLGTGDPNTSNPNPAPDLDQIPAALIERIDVVTGGASAVYGSDAIAGVVNFIMVKNFEGVRVDAQLGADQHINHDAVAQALAADAGVGVNTGHVWDGQNRSFSLVLGSNIADGKGNVTAYLTYLQSDPVTGASRDFAGCQLVTVLPASGQCSGSENSNYFKVIGASTPYTVVGNQFLPWPQAGSNPPAVFNSNPYINMSRDDLRYTAGFMSHVDIANAFKPYVDFSFMNDKTNVAVAPSGLFRNGNPLTANLNEYVNCSNPLLSAQEQSVICTPAQIAADTASPGSASASLEIGRRNVEGGGRMALFDHVNYRAVVGARGDFADAWSYDTYGQYYYTSLYNSNQGYLNLAGVNNALQATGTAANPSCISGPPCVPWNIFNTGGVTASQLNSLYTPGTSYGTVSQRILHADVTGDLGHYGIQLPWATEGIGLNAGYEFRSERLQFAPDGAELSGDLAGFGSAPVAIDNGYSVSEEFAEARIPLAQHQPYANNLSIDLGYRLSDYSLAGLTHTYKFEVQYSPISDVNLRASYQRAVRAPNIIELFTPLDFGLQTFLGVDPCAPTVGPGNVLIPATATLAQCKHTGVTAAEYGNGGSTNTISQCVSGQCGQLTGGNPNLKPERSDSYALGVTLTPSALPGLTGSIDYYDIRIDNEIGTLPGAFYFQQCLITGSPTYCNAVVRTGQGSLSGANITGGGYILQSSVNIGAASISGVDFQGNYRWRLAGSAGSLVANLNGTLLLSATSTPYTGAHTYDCAGLFGTTCENLYPRWRHNLRLTWETPWNTDVSLLWRYIGRMSLDNNSSDPSLQYAEFGQFDYYNATLPSISYLDLSAIWTIHKGISLRAGVNNLLDRDPPLVATELTGAGSANTYPTYDVLGRELFVAVSARF